MLATMILEGRDSGVANILTNNGCTVADRIKHFGDNALNYDAFVSEVAPYLNSLKKAGLITGRPKGAIMSCAENANSH